MGLGLVTFLPPHGSIVDFAMKFRANPALLMEKFRRPVVQLNYHTSYKNNYLLISSLSSLSPIILALLTVPSHQLEKYNVPEIVGLV